MDLRNTRTTILNQGDAEEKREEIRQYFHATFSLDEQLYETLAAENAFYLRPEPLRHPLIFYLGHTATFYVNKLIVAKITNQRINPRFESMFAVGVDEMSWDDLNAAHYDWPTLDEVKAYRDAVRGMVDETIRTMPLTMPINWDNPFWVILMGIEHQRIHVETSSVIIRRLPIEMVRQLPLWSICPETGEAPQNELLPVAGGRVVLGKSKDHPLYGWDNEFGRQENDVWDFSASRYLVSNREYLGFVEDAGLRTRGLLDARGLEMGRLQQGPASPVLDRVARRLPLPDHGPDHRHALGLAGRGELPRGQGILQLAGAQDRKAPAAADRGRVASTARPARHPGPALLAEGPGEHQPGTLGLVVPGESLLLRGVLRHHRQCLAVDGNADYGL